MWKYGLLALSTVALSASVFAHVVPLMLQPGHAGAVMDETQSVQVALNFLTHLQYSFDLTKPAPA